MKKTILKSSLAVLLTASAFCAQAAHTINGAGASFPYPVYAKWASEWNKATGNKLNYQSIGSGGGQQQIISKTVAFGASDDPMSAEKLKENDLLQFPAIIGGTVPVVNVEGVKSGQLVLSGPVIADIFQGKITKWDDKAIAELNPDLKLPSSDIIVVHRSDGSGTTFGWTNYLSKVSDDWKNKVGQGKSVKWPTGQGGKGNEGVAGVVRQMKNTIGYVEYAYAKQNNLSYAKMVNKDGKTVEPKLESFAAAAKHADWDSAPGMGVVLSDEPGADSWPVTAASFILLNKQVDKPEDTKTALEFFDWAFQNGKDSAASIDYVSIPDEVVEKIRKEWRDNLKTKDGSPVWDK
nr:phosphate ABC transporter substrate-binding protein PstS [Brackiella oedipodis]